MRAAFVCLLIILLAVSVVQHCARTAFRPLRPAHRLELLEQ